MSRLVVVSNRVGPIRGGVRAGGLAVALIEALRESGGLWFGWSGRISEREGALHREAAGTFSTATLDLTQSEFEEYYEGFANRCLWPLFHFRIDLTAFDPRFYEGYRRVNRRFAFALLPQLRDDDVLWVHDYHLIPFASELRAAGCNQRMGFFLHVPFPSREVLLTLPRHAQLVQSLFAYDLIGFQTRRDTERFIDHVLGEVPDARCEGNIVYAFGRCARVGAFPIGIDTEQYAGFVRTEDARRQNERARAALRGRAQIIGVDRLDYTKGIPQRFEAFARLLQDYPETRGRVELLQVAPASRETVPEYDALRHELDELAGRVNSAYGDVDWTPLRYMNRTLSRRALAGLYRASRIGLVTPLRDGMNLVAKEYVAAQDAEDPGVLILSCFAGCAPQMPAAVKVNPYDTVGVAQAIRTALYMPQDERIARHRELMDGLLREDVNWWRRSFLAALQRPVHREATAAA